MSGWSWLLVSSLPKSWRKPRSNTVGKTRLFHILFVDLEPDRWLANPPDNWRVERGQARTFIQNPEKLVRVDALVTDISNETPGITGEQESKISLLRIVGDFYDDIPVVMLVESGKTTWSETYSAPQAAENRNVHSIEKRAIEAGRIDLRVFIQDCLVHAGRVENHQGILITHGTDTMVQTARKLVGIPGKTIVLTGSMQPARFRVTDAEFNLGTAVAAVQALTPGVYIVMNGRVFDPLRCRKNVADHRFEEIPATDPEPLE